MEAYARGEGGAWSGIRAFSLRVLGTGVGLQEKLRVRRGCGVYGEVPPVLVYVMALNLGSGLHSRKDYGLDGVLPIILPPPQKK